MLRTKLALEGTGVSSWICVQIYLFPGQVQNLIVRDRLVTARWPHSNCYEHFTALLSQVSKAGRSICS